MSVDAAKIDKATSRLASVLNNIGCLQVAKMASGAKEIGFLCRCVDDAKWAGIRDHFILRNPDVKHFIGTKFFADEKRTKVVYGWSLNFRSDDPVSTAERVGAAFLKSAAAFAGHVDGNSSGGVVDFEVTEFPDVVDEPIRGRADRNKPLTKGGKGASGIG